MLEGEKMMKTKNFWMGSAALAALVLPAAGVTAGAQQQREHVVVVQQDKRQPAEGRNAELQDENVIIRKQEPFLIQTAPPGSARGLSSQVVGVETFAFLSSEMSFDKTVKGAPYSAEAITETIQILGDGNRIVRKNSSRIYRDGEGRTRREQTLGNIGPFAVEGDPPQIILINDPNNGVNYTLDPRDRTARKWVLPRFMATWNLPQGLVDKPVKTVYPAAAQAAGVEGKVKLLINVNEAGAVEGVKVVEGHPLLQQAAVDAAKQLRLNPAQGSGKVQRELFFDFRKVERDALMDGRSSRAIPFSASKSGRHPASHDAKKESLGTQVIEGVEAEGTRTTITIAAGEIGNEQPINIVSERWYSPALQVVVMTRHADPRSGETIYRLSNINRAEPARTLFEVPSDYTIKESQPTRAFRAKRPSDEK